MQADPRHSGAPTGQAAGAAGSSPAFASLLRSEWLLLAAGLAAMFVPSLIGLFSGIWNTTEQGHGPIVLAISVWLLYRKWPQIRDEEPAPAPLAAWSVLLVGTASYAFGRAFNILVFEIGAVIWMLAGIVLLMRGWRAFTLVAFPLFFMLFMIPLPASLVDTVTQPMKLAVSIVAEAVLATAGYPIARSGVIIQIGPYQLLVADACAGLHTLFTLEALGLLYLNLVRHASLIRNVTLAILIVPISFAANVIRVISLTLITYYLGDEAGQGFLHGFAGMVLFMTALLLIIGADSLLRVVAARRPHASVLQGSAS